MQLQEKQERQRQRKQEAKNKLEERKGRILKQLDDREHFKYVVAAEREEQAAIRNLEMELKKEDKMQNVERIRRMDEFMRLQVQRKLQDDDARTGETFDMTLSLVSTTLFLTLLCFTCRSLDQGPEGETPCGAEADAA